MRFVRAGGPPRASARCTVAAAVLAKVVPRASSHASRRTGRHDRRFATFGWIVARYAAGPGAKYAVQEGRSFRVNFSWVASKAALAELRFSPKGVPPIPSKRAMVRVK